MKMQASEILFLQAVGRFVKLWTAPIIERLEKLEKPEAILTPTQAAEVERIVRAELAIKGAANGAHGDHDERAAADRIRELVAAAVADAIAARPDRPGVVGAYIDRGGDLHLTFSDGAALKVGHVVGADADPAHVDAQIKAASEKYPPPKDGKDGFSLDNFTAEFDGERTLTLRFADAAHSKESKFVVPWPLDRGVWREGEYQKGDSVSRDGSTWIAQADTAGTPGLPNSGWRLAVKRGRDGKEGKEGPQGLPGKDGRDGRDLTQLGPDGRKW